MSRTFSLTEGGPFYRLLRRLHLIRPSGMVRIWWIVVIAWLPMMIGAVVRAVLRFPADPTLFDISVHARILIAVPLMFVAERLIEPACRGAIASLYDGDFCDANELDRIVDSGTRLRDAWWIELALAALAVLGGQLVLWSVTGSSGVLVGGTAVGEWSFPRVWYSAVTLSLVQFVLYRWLWRWLIWNYMLVRISRLPLRALATHPDHAAGLSAVSWPMSGFGIFVLALATLLSGAYGTELLAGRTTLRALTPGVVTFVAVATIVAVLPMLLFCGHLFRARRRALLQYSEFARDYMVRFHQKWVDPRHDPDQYLGSPDIQSLNDLGSAFQVIETTRIFVFGPRRLIELWLYALLPMVPLFASTLTFEEALKRLGSAVLGGIAI